MMDAVMQDVALITARGGNRAIRTAYWIFTALFCLQMGFTAYAQLRLPQVAQAFVHLGFPAYFRVELCWAKLAGVVALLLPMIPARIKEWSYAGFAITLVSALIAHFAAGDAFNAWGWAVGTAVLWGLSYASWRRMQAGLPRTDWQRIRHADWRARREVPQISPKLFCERK
jgi:surface polysaccharide O-acyltransferase-like enzyme